MKRCGATGAQWLVVACAVLLPDIHALLFARPSRHLSLREELHRRYERREDAEDDVPRNARYAESENGTSNLIEMLDRSFSYEGRMVGGRRGGEGANNSSSRDFRCGFVCLLGAPNQGKSTLVNALLEEGLCATAARPQTTRHAILGLLTTDDTQACLIDTPGIIEAPAYRLQEGMMEAVQGALRDADVLLVVTDLFSTPIPDDGLFQRVQNSRKPKIVCINKVDLAQRVKNATTADESNPDKTVTVDDAVRRWRELVPDAVAILPMSAAAAAAGEYEKGTTTRSGGLGGGPHHPGVVALRRILTGGPDVPAALRDMGRPIPGMFPPGVQFVTDEQARALLPLGPPLYDVEALTDRPERFIASETIRAALFETLKKELPYCCEVRIVKFKEPVEADPKPLIRIEADVVVERDSQKLIVIGKKGEQIKKIGTLARHKLEEFFQSKVYVNLNVRVDKDWRKSEEKLRDYGYLQ